MGKCTRIFAANCASLECHLPLHAGQCTQEGDQVCLLLIAQAQWLEQRRLVVLRVAPLRGREGPK